MIIGHVCFQKDCEADVSSSKEMIHLTYWDIKRMSELGLICIEEDIGLIINLILIQNEKIYFEGIEVCNVLIEKDGSLNGANKNLLTYTVKEFQSRSLKNLFIRCSAGAHLIHATLDIVLRL